MRIFVVLSVLAVACSREAPPRDYQNNPPAMTHPVTSSAQSPSASGMRGAAPEPNKGVEGKTNSKPTTATASTTTLKDQAPSPVTGTHAATPP